VYARHTSRARLSRFSEGCMSIATHTKRPQAPEAGGGVNMSCSADRASMPLARSGEQAAAHLSSSFQGEAAWVHMRLSSAQSVHLQSACRGGRGRRLRSAQYSGTAGSMPIRRGWGGHRGVARRRAHVFSNRQQHEKRSRKVGSGSGWTKKHGGGGENQRPELRVRISAVLRSRHGAGQQHRHDFEPHFVLHTGAGHSAGDCSRGPTPLFCGPGGPGSREAPSGDG